MIHDIILNIMSHLIGNVYITRFLMNKFESYIGVTNKPTGVDHLVLSNRPIGHNNK